MAPGRGGITFEKKKKQGRHLIAFRRSNRRAFLPGEVKCRVDSFVPRQAKCARSFVSCFCSKNNLTFVVVALKLDGSAEINN